MVANSEVVMDRARVEVLVRELQDMLKNESFYQFKVRLEQEQITIVAHVRPVEIKT